MKFKIIVLVLPLLLLGQKLNAQNKEELNTFGKSIFECLSTVDSIRIQQYVPTKEIVIKYIKKDDHSERIKRRSITELDKEYPDFIDFFYKKLSYNYKKGIKLGIDWRNCEYITTESNYKHKRTNLEIKFSCNNKIYVIRTIVSYEEKYYVSGILLLRRD